MTDDGLAPALSGLDALAADAPTGGPAAIARELLDHGPPTGALLRWAAGLAGHPLAVGKRGAGLAAELLRVSLGHSDIAADRAGPVRRRLVQARLATRATTSGLLDDAALDRADRERLDAVLAAVDELVATVLPDEPAPPAPSVPRLVAGEDVAATPGAVVQRTPLFELIQYLPRTEAVRAVPLLVVAPLANRYYLADLAPGRSLVEHLVAGGQQVLALSWRNPGAGHAGCGLDAYAGAVLQAMDACERITRTPATSLLAIGSGATVTVALLGHLAAVGCSERAACLTLALAALGRPAPRSDPPPEDPAPELLFWAADTTRVPAALRAELLGLATHDAFAHAGAVRVLGAPIDLTKVEHDTYVVAGDRGRWQAGYRSVRLLGGESRFVLAEGGQVEAVALPGDRFRAGPATLHEPERWPATAARLTGSWWADHLGWLAARSGGWVDAPPELGGRGLHAIAPTPGEYVLSP